MDAPTSFDREREEAVTFNKHPWIEIPAEQRGTAMLKKYLANLLCRRIRESFPSMQNTVAKLLAAERIRRDSLGEPRSEHPARLAHLMSIVKEFQDLANKALRSPEGLPSDDIKLCGKKQNQADIFTKIMEESGHSYEFLNIGDPVEVEVLEELSPTIGSEIVSIVSAYV
jgi:hypothetical protein